MDWLTSPWKIASSLFNKVRSSFRQDKCFLYFIECWLLTLSKPNSLLPQFKRVEITKFAVTIFIWELRIAPRNRVKCREETRFSRSAVRSRLSLSLMGETNLYSDFDASFGLVCKVVLRKIGLEWRITKHLDFFTLPIHKMSRFMFLL